ncbi:MAG: hypothetical protein LBP85_05940 [Prevotellaceae bacterium]|jgi:hypothetical protein|nr:hypothetical protein [Prevotellaceae bacterium]
MKFYDIDTEFTFGKHSGKTLREVLEIQPSYIDWCAVNLDLFYISGDVIDKLKSIRPDFVLSEEGRQKMADRFNEWVREKENKQFFRNNYADRDDYDWEAETFDALTDGMYGDYYNDYDGDVDIDSLKTSLGYD